MATGRTRAFGAGRHGSSTRGLADEATGAVVAPGVPAADRLDRDARAGVRRVDEPPPADVEADVAEAVEEDKVARAQRLRATTRRPMPNCAPELVRQRDPEVRVDEAREAGAVEAARTARCRRSEYGTPR